MLLTIHNLPTFTQFSDVKELIVSKCGLKELILDNLQNEGNGMRVTVGVLEEEDAAILVRKINGIYYRGQQLYVEDKRPKKDSEQPYRTSMSQLPQYLTGYDYNPQVQGTLQGMYPQSANYAMYQTQPSGQTVTNNFTAYGGQQPQPLRTHYSGTEAFNEFTQQPYALVAQENLNSESLYIRRSSSRDRSRQDANRWDDGRQGRDDTRRPQSPPAFAPWDSRNSEEPLRQPYQDFHSPRYERPERSKGFDQPQDMYEERGPRQQDNSRGFSARGSHGGHSAPRDMRSGHSSNSRDMRGGHFSSSHDMRGGFSSSSRDMGGGYSSSTRDMGGGYSSSSRDIGGGFSLSSRDIGGGFSSSSRDMRGAHSSNSRIMRGGHSATSRDMRGDHSATSRDMRGGHSEISRDMRGGHSATSRDMRGGHSEITRDMRGGHSATSRDMRGGHSEISRDMRGGHSATSRAMRGGHAPYARGTRDYAPDMQDDQPKYAKKRRWDEPSEHFEERPEPPAPEYRRDQASSQRQSRPLHREYHEPRPKKIEPQPPRSVPDKHAGFAPKPVEISNHKLLNLSKAKGVGKLMFLLATHLQIVPELEKKTSLVKTALRKYLTGRVTNLVGKEILPPEEIVERYRARFPETDDLNVHNCIMQKIAGNRGTNYRANKGAKTSARTKRNALKNKLRQLEPGKIPAYVQGDKQLHIKERKEFKKELVELEEYDVNANFKKAMDEEAELIGAILEKGFKNPQSNDEKEVYGVVDQEKCIEQCKKVVKYHLSKRISNGGMKLVRAHGHPKPPRRADLEQFLGQYDCLSLKKSVKSTLYTASFASYEAVDRLCALGPVEIGDQHVVVTFKHMYLAPKQKFDPRRAKFIRMQYIKRLMEKPKVNLLDKDWQTVEKEEQEALAKNKAATGSDDVTLAASNDVTNNADDAGGKLPHQVKEEKSTAAETTTDNNDFLHVDFKVIDEVRESDNDEIANDAPKGDQVSDGNMIRDDWDETGEDWGDVGGEDNGGNGKDVEDNENYEGEDNERVAGGEDNKNIAGEVEDDENTDKENEGQNIGDIDIEDVDWDDVDEDDLEDY